MPHELTDAERETMARSHGQYLAKRYGVAVDMAIHAPHRDGDKRNFHVHFLLSTREVTPEGFGGKAELELRGDVKAKRGFATGKQQIKEMREKWAESVNDALAKAKKKERVDHRSFEAQGLDRVATKHLGRSAIQMVRKGRLSRIDAENREAVAFNDNMARITAQIIDLERARSRLRPQTKKRRPLYRKPSERSQERRIGRFTSHSEKRQAELRRDYPKRRKLAKLPPVKERPTLTAEFEKPPEAKPLREQPSASNDNRLAQQFEKPPVKRHVEAGKAGRLQAQFEDKTPSKDDQEPERKPPVPPDIEQ